MDLPKLKYVENTEDFFEFSAKEKKCDCCGKLTKVFTSMLYSEEDVTCICPECVVSCKACYKFDAYFNDAEDLGNIEAFCQVTRQTPTIPSNQEIVWPHCCGDYCTYLRRCNDEDLKNTLIVDAFNAQLAEDVKINEIDADWLIVFQCKKCGKYHLELDVD